jgi:hypothetical protein
MTRRLLLPVFILAFFWSCSKLNPKISAPAYLEIDDYTVITDSLTQGTSNHKFSDMLIESSSNNYGYYPFPGKIPLPFNGNTFLIIRPTIKVNGVGALRVDYPLMRGCDTILPLVAGQTLKFKPVFKYFSGVNFRFMEDFNGGGSSYMVNSYQADTFGVKVDVAQKCLVMKLDSAHRVCQAQSSYAFPLPTDGTNIYLEINYKCNTDFEVGLIGTNGGPQGPLSDQRTVGGANASLGWNKMYFSLGELTRTPPIWGRFYLYFYKGTYDESSKTNLIYIDNIKVISQN